MRGREFAKALLGEGLASCDNCGHVAPIHEFSTFYFGENGEHMDLCGRCSDLDRWGSAFVSRPPRRGGVKCEER
jgi:hypothetical protein